MTPDEEKLLALRQDGLKTFYKELMPVLVDFVDRLGIRPPHEVLKHAEQFAPNWRRRWLILSRRMKMTESG